MIESAVLRLIQNAKSTGKGFYWDIIETSHNSINKRPLCGFSIGQSGIAFLFLQLSSYFDNEHFNVLAQQCFIYEDQYLNSNKIGWPNFIFVNDTTKSIKDRMGQLDATQIDDNGTWHSGLIGMGIARLEAKLVFEDTLSEVNVEDISRFIKHLHKHSRWRNFSLSNGAGALAMLAHQLQLFVDSDLSDQLSVSIVEKCRLYFKKNNFYQSGYNSLNNDEDNSLLMGKAGIGYCYLSLYNERMIEGVLWPRVNVYNKCVNPHSNLRVLAPLDFAKLITKHWFPRTIEVISENVIAETFSLENCDIAASFINALEFLVTRTENAMLIDLFNFELSKLKMEHCIAKDPAKYLFIQEILAKKIAEETINKKEFFQYSLYINPFTTISKTRWNWCDSLTFPPEVFNGQEGYTLLLFGSTNNYLELNDLTENLIEGFRDGRKVDDVLKEFISINDFNPSEITEIEDIFYEEVKFLTLNGVLIANKSHY